MPQNQFIKCPKCHAEISVDTVLREQISAQLQAQYQQQKNKDRTALENEKAALAQQAAELRAARESNEKAVAAQVREKLAAEETALRQRLRQEAASEQAEMLNALKEQAEEKDAKLKQLRKREVEFMQKNAALEEQKNNLEIEALKKLEAEKEKIRAEAELKASDAYQLLLAQKDKQLADSKKASEDLKRKLEQGSQQTQGEILELDLEKQLEEAFIYDEIAPVPKGVNGADIIQTVRDRSGQSCGKIIWEAKNTKNWAQGWIEKLKTDQRELGADIALLVSEALPGEIKSFGQIEGVWVCGRRFAIPLAFALRGQLAAVARERRLAVGKNEKTEMLYQYLTGTQFRQRIETIVESFALMQDELNKEKRFFKKKWAQTEKRLEAVLGNTAKMYGELEGIAALPKIAALELEYQPEADDEA